MESRRFELTDAVLKLILFSGESDDQWSPLHIAAKSDFEMFKEILPKFADKNPKNNHGQTPLHCAVINSHLDICEYLLTFLDVKNPPNSSGFTPLHYAAMLGDMAMYKVIDQYLDDKLSVYNPTGITPLDCAVQEEQSEIIKFIGNKVEKRQIGKSNFYIEQSYHYIYSNP